MLSLKFASTFLQDHIGTSTPSTALHCTLKPIARPPDRPSESTSQSLPFFSSFSPIIDRLEAFSSYCHFLRFSHSLTSIARSPVATLGRGRARVFVRTAIRGALAVRPLLPSLPPSLPSFHTDETARITSGIIARIAAEVMGPPPPPPPPPMTFPN